VASEFTPADERAAASADEAFCAGVLAQVAGDLAHAETCYRRALAAQPEHQGAQHHLAIALDAEGRGADAAQLLGAALQRHPEAAAMWLTLGNVLHRLARYAEAIGAVEQALALKQPYGEAENLLGAALLALDRPEAAIPHFQAAIAADPASAEFHSNLGAALLDLDRAAEAIGYCEAALALEPGHALALHNLGAGLLALQREEAALAHLQSAARLRPDDADIQYHIALAQAEIGRLPEAVAALDRAIEQQPRQARFLRARGKFGFAPDHLVTLEDMARDGARLSARELIELHFALGQAYGDLGRYELAIRHWRDGNARQRPRLAYDEAATLARFEDIRRQFTPAVLRRWSGCGHPSARPVFIVGMPRSGSTLIEQILASHPRIAGAGETNDVPELVAGLAELAADRFPAFAPALTQPLLREFGTAYDRRLGQRAPDALRIIDKMLSNFTFVGLIHLALPNARIIHARREPVDTCLSCFAELFARDQAYSYDFGELGRYYGAYCALMAHWRDVLPDGVMIEVDYEAIITDIDSEARRMVAHLGLDWDKSCLDFHRTRRPVRTASLVQVRQPLYRSSIGRSAPYRPYLQPLLDALALEP